MEHIKEIIENSLGVSIAIVGDNRRYIKSFVKSVVLDITKNDVQKYMMIDEDNIKIDQVRMVQDFLSYSLEDDKKIVVIFNADKMLPEAENAILKTLEEPPSYALIILTTTNWNSLYPTIRSRLQKYSLVIPKKCYEQIDSFILKKLLLEFPDEVKKIKSVEEIEILELDEEFQDSLEWYYTIYVKVKEVLGDIYKIQDLIEKLKKIRSFNFLKTLSKVALWICEEYNCDYDIAKEFAKILSSKVANYNYELTYYFILLSLNDSIDLN